MEMPIPKKQGQETGQGLFSLGWTTLIVLICCAKGSCVLRTRQSLEMSGSKTLVWVSSSALSTDAETSTTLGASSWSIMFLNRQRYSKDWVISYPTSLGGASTDDDPFMSWYDQSATEAGQMCLGSTCHPGSLPSARYQDQCSY